MMHIFSLRIGGSFSDSHSRTARVRNFRFHLADPDALSKWLLSTGYTGCQGVIVYAANTSEKAYGMIYKLETAVLNIRISRSRKPGKNCFSR